MRCCMEKPYIKPQPLVTSRPSKHLEVSSTAGTLLREAELAADKLAPDNGVRYMKVFMQSLSLSEYQVESNKRS